MKEKVITIPAPNLMGKTPITVVVKGTYTLGTVKPMSFRKKSKRAIIAS